MKNLIIKSVKTGKMVNCYECTTEREETQVNEIVTVHNDLFPADQWKVEIDTE